MNPMLQRHCAKFIYIVPEGLRELMSDISREVIRSQPEEIYSFIADYLDALMITRENARIAAKMVENITEIAETTVDILLRIGLTRSEADRIVTLIQTCFRNYVATKRHKNLEIVEGEEEKDESEMVTKQILDELGVGFKQMDDIASIIQEAYRKFKDRQQREQELLYGMVDWRIAARSAIALYKKTGVSHYEANRAATLIKAAYKGYYTRRIMRRLLQKGLEEEIYQFDSEISEIEPLEEAEEEYDAITPPTFSSITEESMPTTETKDEEEIYTSQYYDSLFSKVDLSVVGGLRGAMAPEDEEHMDGGGVGVSTLLLDVVEMMPGEDGPEERVDLRHAEGESAGAPPPSEISGISDVDIETTDAGPVTPSESQYTTEV